MRIKRFLKRLLSANFLIGPAIWVSSSPEALIHRRMVKSFRPTHMRLLAWLNVLLCCAAWYLIIVWHQIITALKRPCLSTPRASVADLLYLGLWLGVKPSSYYICSLNKVPKSQWLSYVYPQELVHWHTIQSPVKSRSQLARLNDKHIFSVFCNDHKLRSVVTLDVIEKGQELTNQMLIDYGLCFIKPLNANAMLGCSSIEHLNGGRVLKGRSLDGELLELTKQSLILNALQEAIDIRTMLVQPLLVNHPDLHHINNETLDPQTLITLRVLSTVINNSQNDKPNSQEVSIEMAVLEVPTDDKNVWRHIVIDTASGRFIPGSNLHELPSGCSDILMQFWREIKLLIKNVHTLFSSISSVAWDLAIDSKGPVIIEGNSGWNPLVVQDLLDAPLLSSRFIELYNASNDTQ